MTPRPNVTIISELYIDEQTPRAVCSNSYVAVAWLQDLAKRNSQELVILHTNQHYQIGDLHFGFDEVPMFDMSWLKQKDKTT